jgi:mgtE-like transporter
MTVRDAAWAAYREALPALVASLVGGLVAGLVLSGMRGELRDVSGLLVLVPALLATRGNVYGSLGARVSTALHQGLVEPRVRAGDKRLRAAVAAALANGLLASVVAAVATFGILTSLGASVAPLPVLVAIAVLSGVFSGVTLVVVVVTAVFAGYRRGRDPDTLVGPLVTTTGDVFGMVFLLGAARIVLFLAEVV